MWQPDSEVALILTGLELPPWTSHPPRASPASTSPRNTRHPYQPHVHPRPPSCHVTFTLDRIHPRSPSPQNTFTPDRLTSLVTRRYQGFWGPFVLDATPIQQLKLQPSSSSVTKPKETCAKVVEPCWCWYGCVVRSLCICVCMRVCACMCVCMRVRMYV